MAIRLEIISSIPDTRAITRKNGFKNLEIKNKINEVSVVDIFTIDKKISKKNLKTLAGLFYNPTVQKASYTTPLYPKHFDWAIEIGYLPGVTDNIANTSREMIEDRFKIKFQTAEGVYSSQVTYISGKLKRDEIDKIAMSLHNQLIQRAIIKSHKEFVKNNELGITVPKVVIKTKIKVDNIDLKISDDQLITIGKKGVINKDGSYRGPLALDLDQMKTIRDYFRKIKRNPTDVELESIAQTWSEHCKHTIFANAIDEIKDGLFKTYIKGATRLIREKNSAKGRSASGGDFCASVFTDNSGGIIFDDNYIITDKVETHNTPSALDPFGGSITGIVGVNRDTLGFGLGAKPILNRYGFCFADPNNESPLFKGPNFTQKMLPPKRIMQGVIAGVNSGGNCSGIPSPQGFVYFDKRFKGKPLVFVGTVGLIPRKIKGKKAYVKKARPGDYIVMIGGRVGIDGIHGATFSSEALDTGSPATAVQIGDPITQKNLSDAIVKEARDKLLFNSITDNGAGGLSCSVAEMAKESGGCLVHLDQVPLKYPGLAPWQVWISESQERMTLAVPKNKWMQFHKLMNRHGVEATIIGTFTDSGKCVVKYKAKTVMNMDMEFLHYGLPEKPMQTIFKKVINTEPVLNKSENFSNSILTMIGRQNIASYEFISSQYDHEVQGNSALKPLVGRGRVNTDTTVARPILNSKKGVIISQALFPSYSDIDTYAMAAAAIDTAIRNAVATGADPNYLALLDNFCWCSSYDPWRLWQLKQAAKACYDTATIFETPFISGKDSMFNDFKGYDEKGKPITISIPPTLLISSIGIMNDVTKAVSLDFKFPGDSIYILGETNDELGGSEYYSMIGEKKTGKPYVGNSVPKVDAKKNKQLYDDFFKAIKKELITSAISVGRGGLTVALAKSAIGGMLGADVSLKKLSGSWSSDHAALFSESMGRILVSIDPKKTQMFEKMMKNNYFAKIGTVKKNENFKIKNKKGKQIVNIPVKKLLNNYRKTFKDY